jgi:hypothetical protein
MRSASLSFEISATNSAKGPSVSRTWSPTFYGSPGISGLANMCSTCRMVSISASSTMAWRPLILRNGLVSCRSPVRNPETCRSGRTPRRC